MVLGLKWGSGVLVTHLVDERGRPGWSAPALYKVKEAALGLIAGAPGFDFRALSFPTDMRAGLVLGKPVVARCHTKLHNDMP